MTLDDRILCWELLDAANPAVSRAKDLYELTQAAPERIPWAWIERGLKRRKRWRPGGGASPWHLVVAARAADGPDPPPLGFAIGSTLGGYGGYVSYLGVDAAARGRGVGTRLFEALFALFRADAAALGEPLPFAVWESRPPAAHAPDAARANWRSRMKLFARVGALAVDGVSFLTPDYRDPAGPPVPLRLFVRPLDLPASAFDAERLRGVADGLQRRIYGQGPCDPLYDATLAAGVRPSLRPPADWAEPTQGRGGARLPAECWR